jgi:hypothetical protein
MFGSGKKKSYILRIEGIFIKDILGKSTSRYSAPAHVCVYDSIPKKFSSLSTWPRHSNLHCWSCGRKFSSRPCFIPLNPEIIAHMTIYDVLGNFCRWNCVVRHVRKIYPAEYAWDIECSIRKLYKLYHDVDVEQVVPSPDPYVMNFYCGDDGISSEDYDVLIDKHQKDYSLVDFRFHEL